MNPVVAVIIVSAISGVLAALVAMVISTVTAGTLSPLAGVAIGAAFGVTAGTFVRASSDTRRGQRWAIALLRGVVAGITAGLTIFLVHRR